MEDAMDIEQQQQQQQQQQTNTADGAILRASPNAMDELVVVRLKNVEYEIPRRYKLTEPIGEGSYGHVCAATDMLTGERVAIKKNVSPFEMDEAYQKRILREVKILKHLRGHPNIINLKDLVLPESIDKFQDVYLVTEIMDMDLKKFMRTYELANEHIQIFLYQMIRALQYIHSANILHRDLKPSNILVSEEFDLKICDFGLSRGIDFEQHNPTMSTAYVQTRWYRAPELLCNWSAATKAIDMWSVGCIMAEMMYGKPVFQGDSPLGQLQCIINFVGEQSPDDVRGSANAIRYVTQLSKGKKKKNVAELFPDADARALDLLDKLLQFNPDKRITADEALQHPYLKEITDGEQDAHVQAALFDFSYEDDVFTSPKVMIYEEILDYKRKMAAVSHLS